MSKIIMEDLDVQCTEEKSKRMLAYNNNQQATIGDVKDALLVLIAHLKIKTTCNI